VPVKVREWIGRIAAACVSEGVFELPAVRGTRYFAFCDPSGGSSDSMTLAVAHREGDRVVVHAVRERRSPFDPVSVCSEFTACLQSYGINTMQSDKYAGIWPVEAFAGHGIRVEQGAQPKSDLYVSLLPLLNSKRIELLDLPRLTAQLVGLERRTARFWSRLDRPRAGAHDDIANAVAGVASLALANQGVHVSRSFCRG
jgi:hypothetical protein